RAGAARASQQGRDETRGARAETEGEARAAASEHRARLADATEDLSPDAGSPVAIAAEPIALEPAEDAPAAAAESEPPIELAQLEQTAASTPAPTSEEPREAETHPPAAADTADIAAASQPSDGEAGEAAVAAEADTNITEINGHGAEGEDEVVESVGGADAMEEVPERTPRSRRQYKIQEVIKRRQVMLVQVVKEERGTKGAALTTYLSLAGRYSVLMPNTARGGGISRKITDALDHRRVGPPRSQGAAEGAESAGGQGRHPAHGRREPHQDRDQARLRVPDPAVGDRARPHAQVDGADAGLRGRFAGQAIDPRPLQQ